MAISSEFYKDLSKIETKIWGLSKREFKAYVSLAGITVLLVLEVVFLPDWLFFLSAIGPSFLFGWYPVFLLMNKMKEKKRQFLLHFYYEERVYQAGKIRRYEKSEFIQKEDINETDTI